MQRSLSGCYSCLWRASAVCWACREPLTDTKRENDALITDYTYALEGTLDDATKEKDYFLRGKAYYEEREYDKGIADFTTAIGMKADDAYAFRTLRGDCYMSKMELDKALADFDEVIKLQPRRISR